MNAKAVIFDFNGTLFFDYEENAEAWDITSRKYRGIGFSDADFMNVAGMTDTACARYMFPDGSEEKNREIWTFKENIYKELCLDRKLDLAEGSREFIEMLKARGLKLAIASSCPVMNMEWYIPHFKLDNYFSTIIYGREDLPSKPNPDIYLLAQRTLGVTGKESICFEDAEAGIKAGIAAGFAKTFALESPGIDLSITGKLAPIVNWRWCIEHIEEILNLD